MQMSMSIRIRQFDTMNCPIDRNVYSGKISDVLFQSRSKFDQKESDGLGVRNVSGIQVLSCFFSPIPLSYFHQRTSLPSSSTASIVPSSSTTLSSLLVSSSVTSLMASSSGTLTAFEAPNSDAASALLFTSSVGLGTGGRVEFWLQYHAHSCPVPCG